MERNFEIIKEEYRNRRAKGKHDLSNVESKILNESKTNQDRFEDIYNRINSLEENIRKENNIQFKKLRTKTNDLELMNNKNQTLIQEMKTEINALKELNRDISTENNEQRANFVQELTNLK